LIFIIQILVSLHIFEALKKVNMKKLLSLLLIFTAFIVTKPVQAQQKAKWQELDAFHEVMSKTFHPSEEGKLEPIRSRSAEMVEKVIRGL